MVALQVHALGRAAPSKVATNLGKSPLLLAIVAGLLFNLFALPLPESLDTFVSFTGAAAAPVALFALRVVLSQTVLRFEPVIAVFVTIKLLLFPATVWLGLALCSPNSQDGPMFVLGAAGPSSTAIFGFALLFDAQADAIAQVMVWTCFLTLLSFAILA